MPKASTLHIPSLDGVRAIAALLVFVSHAGLGHIVPGGFGVTVFFFLSGYLITTLLRTEYEENARINLRHFYLRRAFRILPPMYIVLFVGFLVGELVVRESSVTWQALLAQIFHVTNYYLIIQGEAHIAFGTAPMWSLAIEEHFYLLYPIVLIWLFRYFSPRAITAVLLGLCMLVLAWRIALVSLLGVGPDYTYMATDARIDSLLYGCAMAIGFNPAHCRSHEGVSRHLWVVALAAATFALLCTFVYRDEVFRQTLRYSVQGLALIPFFYCAVRYADWPVFRWLEWPFMRRLGSLSYTFYLVHVMALAVCTKYFNDRLTAGIAGLIVTLATSLAMYHLVEQRFARMRKKLHCTPSATRPPGMNGLEASGR